MEFPITLLPSQWARMVSTPMLLALLCLCACMAACAPQPTSDRERARDVFRTAIAKAYAASPGLIVVQPAYAGLPDNPYDALQTGPYFAFSTDVAGFDHSIQGFATADGRSVLARNSAGMGDFLVAARVADVVSTASVESLVERVRWIYRTRVGGRLISFHPSIPDVAPAMHFDPVSLAFSLTYYTEEPRETGSLLTYKSELRGRVGEPFTFLMERVQ